MLTITLTTFFFFFLPAKEKKTLVDVDSSVAFFISLNVKRYYRKALHQLDLILLTSASLWPGNLSKYPAVCDALLL